MRVRTFVGPENSSSRSFLRKPIRFLPTPFLLRTWSGPASRASCLFPEQWKEGENRIRGAQNGLIGPKSRSLVKIEDSSLLVTFLKNTYRLVIPL